MIAKWRSALSDPNCKVGLICAGSSAGSAAAMFAPLCLCEDLADLCCATAIADGVHELRFSLVNSS